MHINRLKHKIMSNYLSTEYKITNPVSSVDLQVVDNTLSTLQGKYNQNSALIEQTLAYYDENLKGIRPEDNSYIAEKLKRVKSTIDEYKKKNVNLAFNYNRDSIMSAVKETLNDPIVKDAIASRQNYVNLQSQISKIKEKDSSKYSIQNEQFALEQGGFNFYKDSPIPDYAFFYRLTRDFDQTYYLNKKLWLFQIILFRMIYLQLVLPNLLQNSLQMQYSGERRFY